MTEAVRILKIKINRQKITGLSNKPQPDQLPKLKNKIANIPLARAKTPQRFNFSFQIIKAPKDVKIIIVTFAIGYTMFAGKSESAVNSFIEMNKINC